ncbi:MAG: UbiA family prenyltransferase [Actinomycetota bacterium]
MLGLLRATHPLPAAAVTVLVGLVIAARRPSFSDLAWAVASTAVGQASVGWSNDYLDRERDAGAGRMDKPLVAGTVRPATVAVAALVAFPASVLLSLLLGGAEALVMLAAVTSAWGYNAGLKGTILSWLPYAVSFGLAPVYVWLATPPGDLPPAWLVIATAMLGVAGHLVNVVPDLEAERGTVAGLPHRLGVRGSLLLAGGLLTSVLFLVVVLGGEGWPPDPSAAAAAGAAVALILGVAWAVRRGRGRLGFRLTIAAAGAIVVAFLLHGGGRT